MPTQIKRLKTEISTAKPVVFTVESAPLCAVSPDEYILLTMLEISPIVAVTAAWCVAAAQVALLSVSQFGSQ